MARALHGTSVEAIHQLVAARRLHDRPDMQMHDTTTTTASYVIPVHYVLNKLQNAQFKDTETLHDKIKPGTAWNEDPVLRGGPILLGALQQLFVPRDLDLGHQADQLCLGLGQRMLLQVVLRISRSGVTTHPDFFHSPAFRWRHQEAKLRLEPTTRLRTDSAQPSLQRNV